MLCGISPRIAHVGAGVPAWGDAFHAGGVILEGFGGQRIPLVVRRLIALIPALAILAVGLDTTQALVLSQVELSFGIPFAFWPLVRLTRDRILMGDLVNDRTTTAAAVLVAAAITALNIVLIVLLLR